MDRSLLVALLAGVLQGIFEWLPISSEGNLTVVLTALGRPAEAAVAFSLFLHLGTAGSASVYYREEVAELLGRLPDWRPKRAFVGEQAPVTFLAVGTLVSGLVGIAAYATLDEVVNELTGGTVVVLVGVLLVVTGLFQKFTAGRASTERDPDLLDAVLVGAAQGVAILPGVSRSGMTTGTLLLRGYDGSSAFRFSFLLSIPAALGGAAIAYVDTGLGEVTPTAAAIALLTAFLVGYATIDALLRVVERVPFWLVCLGLGAVAMLGGALVL
ncbi:undecaprenyl-diphosphate phosphatase [Halomarina oriensis]|uniref:Undecaprenyl-diphosphatase n=1 Tax=Halomarina oriensis TaxID=671145 RepID=A0A6B0GII1_9EURY|nr:undecaprenyl-diphosphate phosphatase [Halomarina oriensis]MWG34440.1 UDP-diphosphatase [Halomarina oriensis]